LAYVIYTSGSTGRPKGVGIQLAEISEHCRAAAAHYQHGPSDCFLQFASLNFDAAIEQIFAPLISGAKVALRGDEMWSAREFQKRIFEHDVSVINLPPTYWEKWLEELQRSQADLFTTRLRLVIVGGDAVRPESLKLWRLLAPPGVRLLNAYGPTETTITATTCDLNALRTDICRVPIGRTFGNRRAYIVGANGQLVPPGMPGELWLGGELARGYLKHPELTAERFLPDPFGGGSGQRLYRTGDLARHLEGGAIEFLGRIDRQVKIRGYRIELGEIEAALAQHPAVSQAIVVVREKPGGDRTLCAYVACDPENKALPLQLRQWAKTRLPEYMVPGAVVPLESIPLTPGGKPDRLALPEPSVWIDSAVEKVPPRNPLEEKIAGIFCEVLGRSSVSVFDDFFDLGGHSILAVQVISRMRDQVGVELPLHTVFAEPTVASLALVATQKLIDLMDPDEALRAIEEVERCA
jgi:amino acid adenylation domain-containing protein